MVGRPQEGRKRALSRAQIQKRYRVRKRDAATLQRRAASRSALPIADGFEYHVGDCREVLADIKDESVALILTDPPYGNEAEPLYQWLAKFAARVLIPGGALICYTGNTLVDRDHAIFGRHLQFHLRCVVPLNPAQRLFGKGALILHRDVLWYTKGPSRHRSLMPTTFISPAKDKLAHPWAQGEGGVWVPIEHLTGPEELILDPFAGTGEWGRIAHAMGRRWIGCDIEEGGSTRIVV
jgi:DNA modification methylase